MPFAALGTPSTALSGLKAQLADQGVECAVRYLNLAFADLLGDEAYGLVAERLPPGVLGGDWVFASCLFGEAARDGNDYLRTVARRLRGAERRALESARSLAADFLAEQLHGVSWGDHDLVGFTSSCEQNTASLAMAQCVKHRDPGCLVMFGGANWEGEMGAAQLVKFPFVDIAFLGEADLTLPLVVDRLSSLDGRSSLPLDEIPGLAYRDSRGVHQTAAVGVVEDLDSLATPDFSAYFSALGTKRRESQEVHLWLQGSRGCWWAERHPCRFCGLNGSRRIYRTKSPQRLLDEIRGVAHRWPACHVDLSDTVVSAAFLDDVVPALAAEPVGVPLWLEVRPELRRRHVREIARAGGEVLIGIESLSEDVLRLMHKGSHVLESLRLLKWCRDEGLRCCWNILYDIPGETNENLMEIVRLIPALHSLTPPTVCMPMQLERFSTFFDSAAAFGIEDVHPAEAYSCIYPWTEEDLGRVAYAFDFRRDRSLVRRAHIRRLQDEVKQWQEEEGRVGLALRSDGCGASVVETRPGADDRLIELDDLDAALYAACDDIGAFSELVRVTAHHQGDEAGMSGEREGLLASRLGRLVDERIMVEVGGRFLSLASVPHPVEAQRS
jgi:ribosomal peptide maturation radical SAM protein 1